MSAGIINNTKHFAVTNTSTLIQDALDAGRLENPYVALVDGELDYNSMEPEEPPQELYLDATYISERPDIRVVGQDPESFCSAVYLDGDYTTNILGDIYTHGDSPYGDEYRYDFGDDGVPHTLRFVFSALPDYAFASSDVQGVVIGDGVTVLPGRCFEATSKLSSVTIPSSVVEIGTNCFYNFEFNGTYRELIFESYVPVHLEMEEQGDLGATCNGYSGDNTLPIYVPDAVVSTYQNEWSWYNCRILGISDRPGEEPEE